MLKAKTKIKEKSKKTSSFTKIKSNIGSKISRITDLKKYWSSLNKEKSVNKLKKSNKKINADNTSKNTVLTLLNDMLKDSKDNNKINLGKKEEKNEIQKKDDIQMKDKEKDNELDLFVKKLYNNQEENKIVPSNSNINTNNINSNKVKEYEYYEKDLMENLHKVKMRRTIGQENEIIPQSPEGQSQSQIKKMIFPTERKPLKENFDENISQNLNDKFPLL